MSRIVYLLSAPGSNTGGAKVLYRHVEALCYLGYDAVIRQPVDRLSASWFQHNAPFEDASAPVRDDDIFVLPEDDLPALRHCANLPNRKVVFCQNPSALTGYGFAQLPSDLRQAYKVFMACSTGMASIIARYFDYEMISVVPAFADERLFRPATKDQVIACTPRKRPNEYQSIRYMVSRLHPAAAQWRWTRMETASEAEVAAIMGSASVFLSLARMEALSITTLEAMASGCLVAGFTGIGPREYTSSVNGFWVDEDDCEAAAQALVRALVLAEQGGGAPALMRHAATATAAQWTHATFIDTLSGFWRDQMGLLP